MGKFMLSEMSACEMSQDIYNVVCGLVVDASAHAPQKSVVAQTARRTPAAAHCLKPAHGVELVRLSHAILRVCDIDVIKLA